MNIPVGVLGIAASFLLIDESRDETHERLDLPGLFASGVGLFALTYGLIEANAHGWGSLRITGAFAIAAVALVHSSCSNSISAPRCCLWTCSEIARTPVRTP